ncbi:hypothetical protein N7509_003811 [Penicillium cosmopolitanum]|uniref:Tachykinin family protein n=1 Tax=Penicillium cosmopolitanum TaxID=1131564 RepID=A0A9W9W5S3_9EURO|nr:uncharacterized protein N7509_003811 [Penicillium cosmopolitanum]KAJ5403940.1 hypothetical protein N7509_003811 [Penicillium cosmopolitanum]
MDHLQSFSLARASLSDPTSQPNAPPLDRPSFTFIDHDDDLTSKRIKDVNARKAIRSHVMRDVRRRERLAGLKRTTRRESQSRGGLPVNTKAQYDQSQEEQKLILAGRWASDSSGQSSLYEAELHGEFVSRYRRRSPTKWTTGYPFEPHLNPEPGLLPTSWFLDPFCTLPGTSELPGMVAHLLYYCKRFYLHTSRACSMNWGLNLRNELIREIVTFPNEVKGQNTKEVELMVRSSFSDPGSFFGLMSMCAAHRAALSSSHLDSMLIEPDDKQAGNDPDYCIMKAKCIREMNVKVRDPTQALTNEAFDTIVNLLTGSLIAGLFDEARIHLTGLRRMVELRGGITGESIQSASILTAIITSDVKAGSGLLVKPVFPLTWDAQPVPKAIQQRIRPPPSSSLHQLGLGFFANTLLIEAVARVAVICFLNNFLIVSPPSSGLGRALTKHLVKAVGNCKISSLLHLPKESLNLFAWALFIGARGSIGHRERIWFVERLARVAMICEWQSWEQVSRIIADYFFVPGTQDDDWRCVWEEAMSGYVIPVEEA